MAKLLQHLEAPAGANQTRKRLGRGESSGLGKTSGRGHKGQKSRAGGYHKKSFEGGQMPLVRRVPKSGFTNIFRKTYAIINLKDLNLVPQGKVVDIAYLQEIGKIKKVESGLKVLGEGELKVPLTIKAKHFSKTALAKIKQAGGTAEIS
ncbi:MAG: 50S ribosomal protein L15 [Deltaproteobacteria bacterium]|nr:50S ribosomal protein L15 [Deltaproteobacteria bacterium]